MMTIYFKNAAINIKKFGLQKQNLTQSGKGIAKEGVEKSAMAGSVKRQVKNTVTTV